MSEDRFSTEEENMADFMAQRLPRKDALRLFGSFYEDVWHFYLEHMDLLELFSEIPTDQTAFRKCLQLCKEAKDVTLFAAALALRKESLQKGIGDSFFL